MDNPNFITIKDLATNLNVNQRTIHRYIKLGMPVHRIGGLLRFDYEIVMDWFKKQEEFNDENN